MKTWKVYKYISKTTGKSYIGITSRAIKERAGNRMIHYRDNNDFWEDIKKYGVDDFDCKVLFSNISRQNALILEKTAIEFYNSFHNGYNQNRGGGGSDRLFTDTDLVTILNMYKNGSTLEAIAANLKLSKQRIHQLLSSIPEYNEIKKSDKDHKRKAELKNAKLKPDPYYGKKYASRHVWRDAKEIGRLYTEELMSIAKIANKYKVSTDMIERILKHEDVTMRSRYSKLHIERIRDSRKGKRVTDETRERMKESQRKRHKIRTDFVVNTLATYLYLANDSIEKRRAEMRIKPIPNTSDAIQIEMWI